VFEQTLCFAGSGRGRLEAPKSLQSWPGIVHGGCLVGLVDAAAMRLGRAPGPRRVDGRLTSSVPTETALDLQAGRDGGTVSLTILQGGHTLTSGTVTDLTSAGSAPTWRGGSAGDSLPMSEGCLACGAQNPLGLQVALSFDEEGVWARLTPRAPWRAGGGRLHAALAPVLLDEVAWWLGALVMKQGGLTNRLAVSLHEPDAPFDGALVASGRFADVAPVDRKRTFWRTESTLSTSSGTLIATASIVFRGGADYSERQMAYFKPRTPPEIFRRMFPNYA
jgi:hypothetical protein